MVTFFLQQAVQRRICKDRDAVLDDESCPIEYQSEWLSQAATANGYGSPMLRGDTDGLGNIFPAPRTVDITDFQNFLVGFTGSCVNWECGNFNGDNVVDVTDFSNHFLPSFSATGGGTYGPAQSIPVPSTLLLLGLGDVLLAYASCRKTRT